MRTLTEKEETYKQFMLEILSNIKYLDYKFGYDSLCFPTEEQVKNLKAGISEHKLRINIQHYGEDSEGRMSGKSWLTYCGIVTITEWSEEAIVKAIFITLIQKLRHEASEVFTYEDKIPFHEHRTDKVTIPQ